MARPRRRRIVVVAVALTVGTAGCGLDGVRVCEAGGGTYSRGTCIRSGVGQQEAEDFCQSHGGVYLGGEDRCEVGFGGP
jgi:hypothetical protein